jgi:hypothetical protein
MSSTKHAVEIARKRLENTAYEVAAKYGLELHSVHFSVTSTEDDPNPHISARLCYTDTRDEQVTTIRE